MPCALVVIGASWGGLVAIERLIATLPPDFAPAVAIAQHRSRDSRGDLLTALLRRHTRSNVCEVSDKDAIVPGRVYVAPPDYHLIVEPGSFALSIDAAVQYSRPSIDVLFDTAADAYGDRLVGVVLTGANSDGAYGLARIKRRGGFTIVQDPATAERPEMPAAAIATAAPDRVLPLEQIGPLLGELCAPAGREAGRPPTERFVT